MQNKRRWLSILLWCLTAGWLILALFLSSQTGAETGNLSMSISSFIGKALGLAESTTPTINVVIRKAAHIIVYLILSGFATAAAINTFTKHRLAWLWPLPICSVIAILDEVRKAAIPGRHCSWSEAGLNVLGCVVGAVVVWAIAQAKFLHKMNY